jgi:hypothetical protein
VAQLARSDDERGEQWQALALDFPGIASAAKKLVLIKVEHRARRRLKSVDISCARLSAGCWQIISSLACVERTRGGDKSFDPDRSLAASRGRTGCRCWYGRMRVAAGNSRHPFGVASPVPPSDRHAWSVASTIVESPPDPSLSGDKCNIPLVPAHDAASLN